MGRRKSLHIALDHLDKGDWDAAHKIVHSDDTLAGCRVHGIVHVMKEDHTNARCRYGRAQRAVSEDTAGEIAALRKAL